MERNKWPLKEGWQNRPPASPDDRGLSLALKPFYASGAGSSFNHMKDYDRRWFKMEGGEYGRRCHRGGGDQAIARAA